MCIISPAPRPIKGEPKKPSPKRRRPARGDVFSVYREGLKAVELAKAKWAAAKKAPVADPRLIANAADDYYACQSALDPARNELAQAVAELVRTAAGLRDPLMKYILHLLRDLSLAEVVA